MTPPTILAPRAVVQALARQVDGLAAGDALDDEGGVLVDEDGHATPRAPWIFSTARRAASLQRDAAVRVVDAVALEDLEALLLPGAGDPEDGDLLGRVVAELDAGLDHAAGDDVDAGVGDDRHHHRDLVDARLLEHELGQPAGLARPTGCRRSRSSWPDRRRGRGRRRTASASRRRRRSRARGCRRTRSRCRPRRGGPARRPASPASSNGVASRAWRVSSSPTPSSVSSAFWRGRASFSMSMWASSATNEPSSSSPSGLISASVMS